MTLTTQITALLTSLTRSQVAGMSREERRLLQEQLKRVNAFCESSAERKTKAGVLVDLANGVRSESQD